VAADAGGGESSGFFAPVAETTVKLTWVEPWEDPRRKELAEAEKEAVVAGMPKKKRGIASSRKQREMAGANGQYLAAGRKPRKQKAAELGPVQV